MVINCGIQKPQTLHYTRIYNSKGIIDVFFRPAITGKIAVKKGKRGRYPCEKKTFFRNVFLTLVCSIASILEFVMVFKYFFVNVFFSRPNRTTAIAQYVRRNVFQERETDMRAVREQESLIKPSK